MISFVRNFSTLFLFSLVQLVQAQNEVRVTVQVLPPYSNDIHDYIGGTANSLDLRLQEQIIVTLQNNSPSETQQIKLIPTITGDNGLFAAVNIGYLPNRSILLGPNELKILTGNELKDINRNLTESDVNYGGFNRDQVVRTGTLPEGNYKICLQAFDYNTNQTLSFSDPQGCSAPIPIAFPDPPVIMYPFHNAEVLANEPQALNISWAPAPNLSSILRYRVRIVELSEINANPYDLMEQSTISFFEEDNIAFTNLFYDQTKPAFKEGNTYAIRIQAYDPFNQLQIKNNGLSEIHIFKYTGKLANGNTLADIDFLNIEPGFLTLVDLENLEIREEDQLNIFNGSARLEIKTDDQAQPDVIKVQVIDLAVQKGNNTSPLIRRGTLRAVMDKIPSALDPLNGWVAIKEIEWQAGTGLGVSGTIQGPDGSDYEAKGNLQVRPNGIYGEITASSKGEEPLFSFGDAPVEFEMTDFGITFPAACKSFDGYIKLFNEEGKEQLIPVNSQACGEAVTFDLALNLDQRLSIDGTADKLHLEAKSLFGSLTPNWKDQSLAYDLQLVAGLGFENIQEVSCGLDLLIGLHSENGIEIQEAGSNCNSSQRNLPLGPAYLNYSRLDLDKLSYIPKTNDWDFAISVDGEFTFPVFGNFTTVTFSDLVIDKKGIQIPAMDFKKEDILLNAKADWGDYRVSLEEFKQSPVTLPIFELDKIGPGDWDFAIKAKLEFADTDDLPQCLADAKLQVTGVYFEEKDIMHARIDNFQLGDCTWTIGSGYELVFNEVSGQVGVAFSGNEFKPVAGELEVDFDLKLGEPFTCADTNQASVIKSKLGIKNLGLNGEVEGLVPPCSLKFGPLSASVTESTLMFEKSTALGQQVLLEGAAELDYKEGIASGSFQLDLKTGEFKKAAFSIEKPFNLNLPSDTEDVFTFKVNRAEINEEGLMIDGRNELILGTTTIGTTFNKTLFDLPTGTLKSGSIIVDSEFAFEASIDEVNNLQFKAVPFDHQLKRSPALLMQLAGVMKIDSTGLAANGSATAFLKFEGLAYDSLYALYDKDFRMGLNPAQIRQGKIEFYYKDTRIAYADADGFHPDWTAFGNAFIPEKIPLPTAEIAYIKIKESDRLLVDISQDPRGNTIVSTKPGQPVRLYLPAFKSEVGQVPQVAVDFNQLLLDAGNGAVIGGSVVATVPDNDPLFDFSERGIPITPKFIAFGVNEQGGNDVSGLFVKGNLNLFKNDLGTSATVIAGIQSDGRLRATVNLPGLNIDAPLEDYSNRVSLNFKSIIGNVEIPLLEQTSVPSIDLSLDTDFQLYNQDNDLLASASLTTRYTQNNLSIEQFVGNVSQQNSSLNTDPFIFRIDALNHLNLGYSDQDGISFDAGLDCTFGYTLESGDDFEFPLKQVELSSLNGITIPAQDIHDGTVPGFDPPTADFGIFRLTPLALRLPSITFDWWNWQVGMPLGFDPKVDLELSFPSLAAEAPEFAQTRLTMNDVGFDRGTLTGSLVPFTFPGEGVPLPVGGDLKLNVKEIGGLLRTSAQEAQDLLIDLKGKLKYPDFLKRNSICTEADISVQMDRLGYFTGQIRDFTPCGQLEQGPLTLKFNSTELNFAVGSGEQRAYLSGSATALIKRENNPTIDATGNIAFDLINGKLLNGKILLTGPFEWQYTERDSLFSFTVQTAELDTVGLKFKGNGSLKLGNGSSNLTFNNPTFSLKNGRLIDGNIKVQNSFALDVALNPVKWSVEGSTEPTQNDPGIRLTMPADLIIDKNGLTVNDSSVASLKYANNQYDLLKVHFDDFNLGLDPVQVNSGKASFYLDSLNGSDPIEIAWYDKTGFHLDDGTNLIKAILPDTLFLPAEEVAYIVLRDPDGSLMVDIESVPEGKKLNTLAPLPLVINSFDRNNPLTADVRLFDLIINDGFEVVQGYIEGDLSDNPINLAPTEDMPLKLTKIAYFKDQGKPYSLYADATLILPEALNEVEVKLEDIEFSAGGFKSGTLTSGTYSATYDPNVAPIASTNFAQGEFTFAVSGVELDFRQGYQTYRISGQVGSNLFRDANGTPSLLHYTGYYDTDLGWEIDLTGAILPVINIDRATLTIDAFTTEITDQNFSIAMDGRFQMEELMGRDFTATIQDLTIGTNGVSVSQVNSNAIQYLSLLNQVDIMKITGLGLGIESNTLNLIIDGSLHFMDRDLVFTDLKIGSDGSFSIGTANANLLTSDFEILGEYLILQQVNLVAINNKVALQAMGEVSLPEPFTQNDKRLSLEIDHLGSVTVDMPSIGVDNIPEVELGEFAKLKITEIAVELDPIVLQNTWFFASANLDVPDKEANKTNTIEFGTPNGNFNDAGISYRYGDGQLRWNITRAPDFEFDQTFFRLSVSNISASGSNGFEVSMDAEAALLFDEVQGSGRVEDILINKDGITWGSFAGATFTLVDFVNIEVGAFEYFADGGTIDLEKGTQDSDGNPTTEVEPVYVDTYLRFGNDLGAALKVSISGDFNVSGEIEEILYYKSGDELYLAIKDVDIALHDYARLYASLEYKKDPTGFLLRVAGSAKITPPGADEIGVVAVGKLATINNKLSFGIFVALEGVPIPIIPAIIEINKIGGGFFYNAEQADLEMVLNASGYQPTNPNFSNIIEGETKFAILFYGGVGIIGTAGTYNFSGTMLMLIKPGTLAIDATFEMLTVPIEGGAYFTMQLSEQRFELEAGGRVKLKDLGVVKGALGVNFTAIKNRNQSKVEWAFTGGTTVAGGEAIEVLNILEANATVIVNTDGFLLDCSISGGFDVWIISIKGSIEATIWYLGTKKQFGAYAEIGVEAGILGGLATLGGTAKGALIIEKSKFLIYASLTGYVKVFGVIDGDVTIWMSVSQNGWKGGKGNSGYEDLIAQARDDARNMNSRAQELLASIEELKNTVLPFTNEQLASAGSALFMATQQERNTWANDFIQNEQKLINPVSSVFNKLRDEVTDGSRPEDYQRESKLTDMKNAIGSANQKADDLVPSLRDLRANAIQWENESDLLTENLLNPVRSSNLLWSGDTAPKIDIDTITVNNNRTNSQQLKNQIDQFNDEVLSQAVETTLANIHKIEQELKGRKYTLSPGSLVTGSSVEQLSEAYQDAAYQTGRFYSTQISYFWALHRWADDKLNNYSQFDSFFSSQALNSLNNQILNSIGATFFNFITVTDRSRLNTVAEVAGKRRELVDKMIPGTSAQTALSNGNNVKNTLISHWNSRRENDFKNLMRSTIMDIRNMHRSGLTSIRDASKRTADSLISVSNSSIGDLQIAHGKFTQLVDDIYQTKYSMTTNLHAMMEAYRQWKSDALLQEIIGGFNSGQAKLVNTSNLAVSQEDPLAPSSDAGPTSSTSSDPLVQITNDISELENLLIAPRVQRIGIFSARGANGFDRKLIIDWSASHDYPWMGIVESSYNIAERTATNVYFGNFLSSGKKRRVNHIIHSNTSTGSSKTIGVKVRVRGPGGNTITRFANETISLDPTSSNRVTGNPNASTVDSSPPLRPIVIFPYSKHTSPAISGRKYWSNDQSRIKFNLIAADNESDISKIEYTLGTSLGSTDVSDWNEAYGRDVAINGLGKEVNINNLRLEVGVDYYLSIRVTNGEGLQSPAKQVSTPIRLDLKIPESPVEEVLNVLNTGLTAYYNFWTTTYQANYVTSPPLMEAPPTNVNKATPGDLRIKWSEANDALSGIKRYQYVISSSSNPNVAFEQEELKTISQSARRELILTSSMLDYNDSTYVHVRALDYAGNLSFPLTISRLPKDPSTPTTPKTTVMATSDGLNLFLTRPSFDPETKIRGYQYAVGTSPYGTNVKNWPLDDELDQLYMNPWAAVLAKGVWLRAVYENGRWNSGIRAPHYEIDQLNEGIPYYISYRTLNGQNMKSSISASGPVRLDSSTPPEPSVTLSLSGSKLKIDGSNIQDPETGIKKVEYKVIDKYQTTDYTSYWYVFKPLYGISYNPVSGSKEVTWTKSLDSVKVGIRLTNGNGMQSTYWFDGLQYAQVFIQSGNSGLTTFIQGFNFNWDN